MTVIKFNHIDGKVQVNLQNADKEHIIEDAKSLDEVLHFGLLEFGMNVFEIVDLFKEGLRDNAVSLGVDDPLVYKLLGSKPLNTKIVDYLPLKLSGCKYLVKDGANLGEILASKPADTIKHLKNFYMKYFEIEFVKAYHKNLGLDA